MGRTIALLAAVLLAAAPCARGDDALAEYPAAQCPAPGAAGAQACITAYVSAARAAIGRIESATSAQVKQTMDAAAARIRQIRKQKGAAGEIEQVRAQEAESLGKIGNGADAKIQRINARIAEATGEAPRTAAAAPVPPPVPQPAAPALERVTVTAARPSAEAIASFILSHGTGTRLTGKLARWKMGICPRAEGLTPDDAAYLAKRIRDIAATVGAPVNPDPTCKTNIRIAFTPAPQDFLDGVRKQDRGVAGYADSLRQAARLATVTRAVQAWYTTATEDLRGRRELDTPRPAGGGMTMEMPAYFAIGPGGGNAMSTGTMTMTLPGATTKAVTGGRTNDGLSSEFDRILIVADSPKVAGVEARSLADYIAVLALSQPDAIDRCESLPSIVNLLTPGCAAQAASITDGDVAYLRGLYRMTPTAALGGQRDAIAYEMRRALEGR